MLPIEFRQFVINSAEHSFVRAVQPNVPGSHPTVTELNFEALNETADHAIQDFLKCTDKICSTLTRACC